MPLAVGTRAPDFTLVSQDREKISPETLRGKRSLIVFMPYPFTSTCDSEMCDLRDNLATYSDLDTNVVVITCHPVSTNRVWAAQNGYDFPILADYWPHGEVSRLYDSFDEQYGYSKRTTYVLDVEGIIREVIASDALGEARDYAAYPDALATA
jgi:peroxiredoxin (alkyl hydroperoxide reductase subunit C)